MPLKLGDLVQYQGKMYVIDQLFGDRYHLEGTARDYYISRRHLRLHPLTGKFGRELREAVDLEPPTYADAIKRINEAGITMSDIVYMTNRSHP